jgi:uncharacterized protein YndB with AHSA1/START domain
MTDDTLKKSVTIEAPIDAVWAALTTPALIKQWFFGVDTETDWKVGSPIVHRGIYQGKPYLDKGKITRFEPPHVLAHTHWSEGSGKPDDPANYERVTWELAERDGGTTVMVSEQNLPSQKAKEMSAKSWDAALGQLKKAAEGKTADEDVRVRK